MWDLANVPLAMGHYIHETHGIVNHYVDDATAFVSMHRTSLVTLDTHLTMTNHNKATNLTSLAHHSPSDIYNMFQYPEAQCFIQGG